MKVDPNRKWTNIYHLTVRHVLLGVYPLIMFILFYISLLQGATGVDWTKFNLIRKSYIGLYIWFFKYWTYLKPEDISKWRLFFFDYIFVVVSLLKNCCFYYVYYGVYLQFLYFYFYVKSQLKKVFNYFSVLPFGIGDIFSCYCFLVYLFFYFNFGIFRYIYYFIKTVLLDFWGLFNLVVFEEVYYNYLVALAFNKLSNSVHFGGSKWLSLRRFWSLLPRGLSIGAYGVHFQSSLENSTFGRFFKFIKRGPYMWKSEEPKMSTSRLDHFFRVLVLRLLVIFYFFLPDGEEYRRRSVLWQLLISDLPEDRYIDFTLTPGLRYQAPLYFFIYSNFFAIDVQEYSEIVFQRQQEELILFLWYRKKYFNKVKNQIINLCNYVITNLYHVGYFLLFCVWWVFCAVYLLIYFVRSFLIIFFSLFQISVINIFVLFTYIIRKILIFQINSLLFSYRVSLLFTKVLSLFYDLLSGILLFVVLFTLVIGPSYYYIIQLFWGMGGIFLAYFYIIWVPLLLLAGIYDEWKLVLHELGEWLFVVCFHMGGWSVLFLRIELMPRYWFLEPEYELNPWGPMSQEYQGFYLVYAGWFMDLFYTIFVA